MATNRYPDQGSALRGQLLTNGYTFPFDISPIVDYAARHDLGIDYVLGQVYKSPAFKKYFPGIFRPDGTLRMSPAQYMSYKEQATNAAAGAGFSLTSAQIGTLIGHEVSADEFAFRVQAASEIRANKDLLGAFNAQLKSAGQRPINNAQTAFNFMTGKASLTVYQLYESAGLEAAFKSAGISGSEKQFQHLAASTTGVTSYQDARKAAQQLAQDRLLGDAELSQFGLSLDSQERVALGTADAKTVNLYTQALKQRQAALQGTLATQRIGLTSQGRPVVGGAQEAGY